MVPDKVLFLTTFLFQNISKNSAIHPGQEHGQTRGEGRGVGGPGHGHGEVSLGQYGDQ